jgi:hypothetical protein
MPATTATPTTPETPPTVEEAPKEAKYESTPTDYELEYTDQCEDESSCGDGPCLGQVKQNAREQTFCKNVTIERNCDVLRRLTVNGRFSITRNRFYVGGVMFRPRTIKADSGVHLVLAAY